MKMHSKATHPLQSQTVQWQCDHHTLTLQHSRKITPVIGKLIEDHKRSQIRGYDQQCEHLIPCRGVSCIAGDHLQACRQTVVSKLQHPHSLVAMELLQLLAGLLVLLLATENQRLLTCTATHQNVSAPLALSQLLDCLNVCPWDAV
jgi:hypothetical protein